jgi:hypothetical protein
MELNNEVLWKDKDQSKQENDNFRQKDQDVSPDHNAFQPQINMENEEPKPEKVERGNGENDRPHKGGSQQGEDDDAPNIPGPNELPDQQKVGEDIDEETYQRDHIET